MWYMQYVIHSVENTRSTYVEAFHIHITVTCVVKFSVNKVHWKNTTVYILESVYTYVKCVIVRLLRMSALIYHQHVHTGVHPYTCHVCSNSFSEKGMFKKHQVAHTEKHPFTHVCNKTFKLKKHLRIIFCFTVQTSYWYWRASIYMSGVTSHLVSGISKYRWQLTDNMLCM